MDLKMMIVALSVALILGACTGGNYLVYPAFPQTDCATCADNTR